MPQVILEPLRKVAKENIDGIKFWELWVCFVLIPQKSQGLYKTVHYPNAVYGKVKSREVAVAMFCTIHEV